MATATPYLLQQFLRDTDLPEPPSSNVARHMQTALAFFHTHLAGWTCRPLDETDPGYRTHGFNPFGIKSVKNHGKVTKLTSAMQAMDFNEEVQEIELFKGKRLRRFGKVGEPRGVPSTGVWYTETWVPASKLSLPPDQATPHGYEVSTRVWVLSSTAGDLLVDWGMDPRPSVTPTQGVDYHYRHGGGAQFVIPKADRVLRPL